MIYLFVIFLIFCGIIHYDLNSKTKSYKLLQSIGFILFIVVAFRYKIGIDSMRFEDYYSEFPTLSSITLDDFVNHYEPAWILLGAFFKSFSPSFLLIQIFSAALLFKILINYFKVNSPVPYISLFLFFFPSFFEFSFESTREACAISIFLFLKDKLNRTLLNRFIIIVICCLFHYGAIVLLFYFVSEKINISIIKLMFMILFIMIIMDNIVDILLQFGEGVGPIAYKVRTYTSRTAEFNLFSFIKLFCLTVPLLLYCITNVELGDKKNSFLVYFAIVILSIFVFPIASRFANYFLVDFIVAYSIILHKWIQKKHLYILFCGLIIYMLPGIAWMNIKTSNTQYSNYMRYFPYENIIFPNENSVRQDMMRVEF